MTYRAKISLSYELFEKQFKEQAGIDIRVLDVYTDRDPYTVWVVFEGDDLAKFGVPAHKPNSEAFILNKERINDLSAD